jgi:hypothetical protein
MPVPPPLGLALALALVLVLVLIVTATETASVSLGAAMPICSHSPRYVLYVPTLSSAAVAALHCVQTIAANVVSSAHAHVSSRHCGRVRLSTAQPPPGERQAGVDTSRSDRARARAEVLPVPVGTAVPGGEGTPELGEDWTAGLMVADEPVADAQGSMSDSITSDD